MLGSPARLAVHLDAIGIVTICQIGTISRKDLRGGSMEKFRKISFPIGYYLAGFADGEGSFNVSFRLRNDYKQPWKISLCFNISQKDKVILALFKRHLGCGTLRPRQDGVWYYEVNNFRAIVENVIPFFKKFRFLSAKKKRDFSKFVKIAKMIKEGEHLTQEGIKQIMKLRRDMNDGGKRKYSEEYILRKLSQKSSETIRQSPDE